MARSTVERHVHSTYKRLYVIRRSASKSWYAETFLDGRKVRNSLKASDLRLALRLAERWYRDQLRSSVQEGRKHPLAQLGADPTVAEVFRHYRSKDLTVSKRHYADMKWSPIQHFWRTVVVSDITAQTFRDFYAWRRNRKTPLGRTISNNALHKDMMVVRQILKFAVQEGHLNALPPIPAVGRIAANPRPWLTRTEWDHLVKVSEKRIDQAFNNNRLYEQRVDVDEFAKLMVTTMCRVGELLALRFRDCRYERGRGPAKRDEMLVAEVTGKRGTRTIVAPPEAARLIKNRRARLNSVPKFKDDPSLADDQRVFPEHHRDGFRELLRAANLHKDTHGFTRNFKSLRATAISLRLLAAGSNANLLMIARAAGTSVLMIDQFYARRLSAEMFKDDLATTIVEID